MAGAGLGHEVVVARREGEGDVGAAAAVVGVMKPLMMTRRSGGLVGQRRWIHSVLLLVLKEGENGIIIDWPINQTNRGGQRKWWRDGGQSQMRCALGYGSGKAQVPAAVFIIG